MTSDHVGATVAYMLQHEEHLWNVSVLQRVHLSNLVCENQSSEKNVISKGISCTLYCIVKKYLVL
jgi:hypothetical protein